MMQIKLHSNEEIHPPAWAQGEQQTTCWYFENEHGEQWVAKVEDDLLLISGLDLGWEEISLTLLSALSTRGRLIPAS